MHQDFFTCLLSDLLLPVFMLAVLFGLLGVGAEVVIKAAVSVFVTLITLVFKLLHAILKEIVQAFKKEKDTGK